jgi:hypothetical protein
MLEGAARVRAAPFFETGGRIPAVIEEYRERYTSEITESNENQNTGGTTRPKSLMSALYSVGWFFKQTEFLLGTY